MAACAGMTPAVTKRNGGRGSSSKLVRLIVVSTLFVRGSMTLGVLESWLVIKPRSSGSTLAGRAPCAIASRAPIAAVTPPAAASCRNSLRVISMGGFLRDDLHWAGLILAIAVLDRLSVARGKIDGADPPPMGHLAANANAHL